MPDEAIGCGFHEAVRGVLSHHLVIRNGKIANYHPYPPTPWNANPRDIYGTPGPYEDAVQNTPIFEENGPDKFKGIDIMRAVRSFDPCLPCGVHMYLGKGKVLKQHAHADARSWAWPRNNRPRADAQSIPDHRSLAGGNLRHRTRAQPLEANESWRDENRALLTAMASPPSISWARSAPARRRSITRLVEKLKDRIGIAVFNGDATTSDDADPDRRPGRPVSRSRRSTAAISTPNLVGKALGKIDLDPGPAA